MKFELGGDRVCTLLFALWLCAPIARAANATSDGTEDNVSAARAAAGSVTLLLRNANVYTMDATRTRAQAIAVAGDRIVAVGSDEAVMPLAASSTQIIDLGGAFVLPGFHDAHVHLVGGGVDLLGCDLSAARSVDAIVATLRGCAERTPAGWLIGSGWDLSLFAHGNPEKALLDAIDSTRPIFLTAADGHSAWANSNAFDLAGIEAQTPDPARGVIERDTDGAPSGTLRETAMALLTRHIPPLSIEQRLNGLRVAANIASRFGITSAIEANASAPIVDAYAAALAGNALPLRIVVSLAYRPEQEADVLALWERSPHSGQLRVSGAKLFVDGVLEGETAALLDPYLDRTPTHRGSFQIEPDALSAAVTRLDALGMQVHMHAIGDAAVRAALDAVAAAQTSNARSAAVSRRHHIAHLQLVHPDDYPRFAELGVSANFQALWAFPDDYIRTMNTPQVGAARVQRMYPIASLARGGARIVGGSDWNVSSMNPLDAIEVGVTRQDPRTESTEVLNADERMQLDAMLAAYTIDAAWLMHAEHDTGSIETGKYADLVVLDRDLFTAPPRQINEAQVLYTLFGGRIVYGREAN